MACVVMKDAPDVEECSSCAEASLDLPASFPVIALLQMLSLLPMQLPCMKTCPQQAKAILNVQRQTTSLLLLRPLGEMIKTSKTLDQSSPTNLTRSNNRIAYLCGGERHLLALPSRKMSYIATPPIACCIKIDPSIPETLVCNPHGDLG
jgi:hypothetical protein